MELFTAEQLAYLDSLFVKKNDCSERHEKTEKEISEILITQSSIATKLSFIEKLGGFTLTAALGGLIAQICSVIFK